MSIYTETINQSELGKADRVFTEYGHTFKLAEHLETGVWAIWHTSTLTDDWDTFFANCDELMAQGLDLETAAKQAECPKLAEPVKVAMLVSELTPEYARENDGIFETRCLDVISEMKSYA